MASRYANEKRRRKEAIRETRRRQRAVDSSLERIERRLFRLLQFKDIITRDNVESLIPMYSDFQAKIREMEKALADAISIISV